MIMKKEKVYIKPSVKVQDMEMESLLDTATALDPTQGNQEVTPTEDPYDGEFGAKGNGLRSVWDE